MKHLPFLLMLVCIPGMAQIKNFSIGVSTNYPLINSSREVALLLNDPVPTPSGVGSLVVYGAIKETYKAKAGATLSGSMDIGISRRFFITTGISFSQLRFTRLAEIQGIEYGVWPAASPYASEEPSSIGSMYGYTYSLNGANPEVEPSPSQRKGETTARYVEVPVLAGTAFLKEKLSIRAGAIGACFIQATEYRSRAAQSIGLNISREEYKEKDPKNFTSLLMGAMAEVNYQLTKRISVELAAKNYFQPIYKKDNSMKSDSRYLLLSAGVRYTFQR